MYLLKEICELIDDEETMVKIEALTQLVKIIPLYSQEEIQSSPLLGTLEIQFSEEITELQI